MAAKAILIEFDALLVAERQVLRAGDFGALAETANRKSALLDQLARTLRPEDRQQLDRLKSRADSNQRLMTSALHGVRAVRARIKGILAAQHGMNTYDNRGQVQSISTPINDVEWLA